jgi:hypothetical protein
MISWISSNRRTFSIAINAWSAKVSTSSICLDVKGSGHLRPINSTPMGAPARMSGTASTARKPATFWDGWHPARAAAGRLQLRKLRLTIRRCHAAQAALNEQILRRSGNIGKSESKACA